MKIAQGEERWRNEDTIRNIWEVERNGKTATYKTVSPTFWRLSHSRQDSDLVDNVIKVE